MLASDGRRKRRSNLIKKREVQDGGIIETALGKSSTLSRGDGISRVRHHEGSSGGHPLPNRGGGPVAVLDAEVKRRALAARESLERMGTVRAVYVFGSHVNGSADQWSDIDVAAFMDGIDDWSIQRPVRAMTQVQRDAGLDIEAHLFPDRVRCHPQRGSFSEYILKHGVRIDKPPS